MAQYLDGGLVVGWHNETTRHHLQAPPKGHDSYLLDGAVHSFLGRAPSRTHGTDLMWRAAPRPGSSGWRRHAGGSHATTTATAAASHAAVAEDDDASPEASGCPMPR